MRRTRPGMPGISLALLILAAPTRAAAQDCSNPDDPFQVLDFHLEMDPADWDVIRRDTSFEIERAGTFRCEAELPRPVRIRRKRSDALPSDVDPRKVSLKVDFDDDPEEGDWHSHRKLSLESGVIRQSLPGALLREGISWIVMQRSGAISGAASWVRVHLNGEPLGIYTRVEEIDKSFLRRHLDEDEGFLYKYDPTQDPTNLHRRLTREGEPDPHLAALCWEPFDRTCPRPPDARARLEEHLGIRQLITMGAVNTLLGNTDGLLESIQNYYFYNSAEPRIYFPWDLDLTMLPENASRPPHASGVDQDLFAAAPDLKPYFDAILGRLIEETMSDENIDRLLDEIAASVGPAISADPLNHLQGGFDAELERIRTWLKARTAFLRIVIPTYPPAAVVINELLAINVNTNRDERGDPDDWVEILNRGAEPVALGGLFLSDNPANPLFSPLPDVILPPGGTLLVWCDAELDEGPGHAAFKLDKEGECVGIYEDVKGLVRAHDFLRFDKQEPDRSTGRARDGAPAIRHLDCPTPGVSNATGCPDPVFRRGDVNDDGAIDVADAISGLEWLFRGGTQPGCAATANVDGSGGADITDAIYLLTYLFRGGPPPEAPHPACGPGTLPEDADACAKAPESCRG